MNNSRVSGTRAWLITQMKSGMHVEEFASAMLSSGLARRRGGGGGRIYPVAIALQDTVMTGVHKPHAETLQQLLSSGAEIDVAFELQLKDIVDVKVRKDFMAHRESIKGKQCQEAVLIFYKTVDSSNISCKKWIYMYTYILLVFRLYIYLFISVPNLTEPN
jgi:hypothetical protein